MLQDHAVWFTTLPSTWHEVSLENNQLLSLMACFNDGWRGLQNSGSSSPSRCCHQGSSGKRSREEVISSSFDLLRLSVSFRNIEDVVLVLLLRVLWDKCW